MLTHTSHADVCLLGARYQSQFKSLSEDVLEYAVYLTSTSRSS